MFVHTCHPCRELVIVSRILKSHRKWMVNWPIVWIQGFNRRVDILPFCPPLTWQFTVCIKRDCTINRRNLKPKSNYISSPKQALYKVNTKYTIIYYTTIENEFKLINLIGMLTKTLQHFKEGIRFI